MKMHTQPANVLTVLLGLCFIAAGMYAYVDLGRFLQTAQPASGTVVEIVHQSETTRKGRTHPVVRFRTKEGREVTIRPQQHYNVRPGETLELLYDPANPEQAEVGTLERAQKRRIVLAGAAILFGIVVCVGGVVLNPSVLGITSRE